MGQQRATDEIGMGNQSVEEEIQKLRAEVAALKRDLQAKKPGVETHAASRAGAKVRQSAERIVGEVEDVLSNADQDLEGLEDEIGRHPLASVLVAFCVGLLVGRLIGR